MTDPKTTIWGALSATGLAVFTYMQTNGDISNPAFWFGLLAVIGNALHGYFSADK
jgi:hypothetical protein